MMKEMCQNQGDLYNSVNFPYDKNIILQNYAC